MKNVVLTYMVICRKDVISCMRPFPLLPITDIMGKLRLFGSDLLYYPLGVIIDQSFAIHAMYHVLVPICLISHSLFCGVGRV